MLKEKMAAAKARKENDITRFIWKGKKVEVDGNFVQSEVRLVDMSEDELKTCYAHCESMLHNEDKENPGRLILRDIINDQIRRCNTELFLRYMAEEPRNMPKFVFLTRIRNILANNPSVDPKVDKVERIIGGCPAEYAEIPIDLVVDGCLDRLGRFNRKHITLTFILKQGLRFTEQEAKEMAEYQEKNNLPNKLEAARHYLGLKPVIELEMNSKGLYLAQMRAMIKLISAQYSALTSMQLLTLRNKILSSLYFDVDRHIKQWEAREAQILKVAEAKGYSIDHITGA